MQKKSKHISKEDALIKMQRYCAYQDRCHQEVRSKLLKLEIYGQDLEEIIVELITDDFLNEERYARSYVRGKFRIKHWGRNRLLQELKRRKVSEYCIRKAMEEIDEEEYMAVLSDTLLKKSKALKEKDPFKQKAKLARFAIGRGFEPNLVWEKIKSLYAD